jgi:hypothetical protein
MRVRNQGQETEQISSGVIETPDFVRKNTPRASRSQKSAELFNQLEPQEPPMGILEKIFGRKNVTPQPKKTSRNMAKLSQLSKEAEELFDKEGDDGEEDY